MGDRLYAVATPPLLERLPGFVVADPEALRSVRAVWVLQRCGTPESRQLLEALAAGVPEERLTREARNALDFLDRRDRRTP